MENFITKKASTLIGIIVIVIMAVLIFGGAFLWLQFKTNRFDFRAEPVPNEKLISQTADWKTYTNTEYGFEISFPDSWIGYSVTESLWSGFSSDGTIDCANYCKGAMFIFKNNKLYNEKKFKGIPIMVMSSDIWNLMEQEKILYGAGPVNPGKIGQNGKFVFAMPPRWYGFSDILDSKEIEEILKITKTFKAF